MRWTPGGPSRNIEDRRGQRLGPAAAGLGVGGTIVVLILTLLFGGDVSEIVGDPSAGGTGTAAGEVGPVRETPEEARMVEFVSFVLDDAQETWAGLFRSAGGQYEEARLVLFRDMVQSACGTGQAAMGPFYCPLDHRVYLDLGFFEELDRRHGAPGDFAQAYVIAHEIGHHVQRLLGTTEEVRALQQRNPRQANELSVRLELQADCYAGVWGHATARRNLLESGDVEEGLAAAAAVGDDRLRQGGRGRVQPETFTHGTSAQRMEWFRRGLESGRPESCETF